MADYSIVAMKPGKFPGAYASCVDDPQFLAEFVVRELRSGATLKRVSHTHAGELLDIYLAWCDQQDKAKTALKRVHSYVAEVRRKALAKPIPRDKCPGCFSAIYDGAAEQGWCCDCFPKRAQYEANTPASTQTKDQR